MELFQAIVAFHINAFTFLWYEIQTHVLFIVSFAAIAYLFYQDLKSADTKYVYDHREML